MEISIIIPLFNKAAYIRRALSSTLAQSRPAREVIVVDDGSTDGSFEIAQQFGDAIRLIRQANAGPSAARNHGARLASGDGLIFLDADDELLPEAIAAHAAYLETAPDVDLSMTSFQGVTAGGDLDVRILPDRVAPDAGDHESISWFSADAVVDVHVGCVCVTRSLFDRIGGWDESLRCWEVTDFLVRAGLAARRTVMHRAVGLNVHASDNSQFAATEGDARYRITFASKLADRLTEMRPVERIKMMRRVQSFATTFWQLHEVEAFHRLSVQLWSRSGCRSRLGLLTYVGLLPVGALRALRRVR